ncbi:MAG: alanine dehydrogenase, partial [Actinobacteria bacterium]
PVFTEHGVIHYAVGNIPGAVPNTSTFALTNATLPYTVALAGGLSSGLAARPELVPGINVANGRVTNRAVAAALGLEHSDPLAAISAAAVA